MDRRTILILTLACLAAAGGWWLQNHLMNAPPPQPPAPVGVKTLAIGDSVGAYALPDLDRQTTALAKWRGKVVLLNFWATWCAPCRREMPMLAKLQRKYANDDLQVVGVAMDQPQSAAAFLKSLPVGYPILIGIDADPVPTTTFGDTAGLLPYSVLIGRDGRILETRLGPLKPDLLNDWLKEAEPARP
ncbi:MAG TPA: TlpA disulfide reductase family protein [Rhodanobacteraceae bacterium]|nr:TlpA disulfide reductase family protein [Rhodanobacteraceae bacterium]